MPQNEQKINKGKIEQTRHGQYSENYRETKKWVACETNGEKTAGITLILSDLVMWQSIFDVVHKPIKIVFRMSFYNMNNRSGS